MGEERVGDFVEDLAVALEEEVEVVEEDDDAEGRLEADDLEEVLEVEAADGPRAPHARRAEEVADDAVAAGDARDTQRDKPHVVRRVVPRRDLAHDLRPLVFLAPLDEQQRAVLKVAQVLDLRVQACDDRRVAKDRLLQRRYRRLQCVGLHRSVLGSLVLVSFFFSNNDLSTGFISFLRINFSN